MRMAASISMSQSSGKNKRISIKHVLNGFGCEGGNISPSLNWKNPPSGTKSFVVTVYDPDAATGSGWWRWVVFNIPVPMFEVCPAVQEVLRLRTCLLVAFRVERFIKHRVKKSIALCQKRTLVSAIIC
jgi:hypothetical protein